MNTKWYKGAIEAVLFAVADPLPPAKIADAVGIEKKTVSVLLAELGEDYEREERGLVLLRFEDRYQIATRPAFADCVTRALNARRNMPLSQAALEVLAIVAYNQPVSRSFIDQVRGVDSSSPVQSLLGKNLICEAGRLDLPGRPVSFATTDNFLRCFGLHTTGDLPPIRSEGIQQGERVLENAGGEVMLD